MAIPSVVSFEWQFLSVGVNTEVVTTIGEPFCIAMTMTEMLLAVTE
jgi:uncharacterized membrane protein (DUF485 family)